MAATRAGMLLFRTHHTVMKEICVDVKSQLPVLLWLLASWLLPTAWLQKENLPKDKKRAFNTSKPSQPSKPSKPSKP
eukprot:COSAG01_NODE_1241_length_11085_cov_9.712361_5_plen_77_part_00